MGRDGGLTERRLEGGHEILVGLHRGALARAKDGNTVGEERDVLGVFVAMLVLVPNVAARGGHPGGERDVAAVADIAT
jgi:hypothetical protein